MNRTRINKFKKYLNFFLIIIIIVSSCSRNDAEKKIKLNLKFSDSLLRDTVPLSVIIDSLKQQILSTENDTIAIHLISELSERWRGPASLILADEAFYQSEKLNYEFGMDEARCKKALAYVRALKFNEADSLSHEIIKSTKFGTWKSNAFYVLGDLFRIKSKLPQSISMYEEAIKATTPVDTNRIMPALAGMADSYRKLSELEKSDSLFDVAIIMANKKNNNLTKIFCIIYKGELLRAKADYVGALEYYEKALALSLKMRDKYFLTSCYSNMGDLYRLQNDYPNSLRCISNSLSLAKELNDERRMSVCFSSIGSIYVLQKDYTKAKHVFLKAKEICDRSGDKNRLAFCLSAIGEIYMHQSKKQYEEQKMDDTKRYALSSQYYKEALEIAKEIGDQNRVAHCLSSLGNICSSKAQYDSALYYFNTALELSKKIKDANMESYSLFTIASMHFEKGNEALGMKYAKESFDLAMLNTIPMNIVNSAEVLYQAFKRNGNHKEALRMHELYTLMKDSLYNEEQIKKFADVEFKAKEAELYSIQVKKDAGYKEEKLKRDVEIKKQKLLRNGLIIGAILLLGIAFMIYRNLRRSREAQRIIAEQKKEVEQQKHIVDEKQKEILDSIYYARRIQQARLPTTFYIEKSLNKLKKDY